MNKKRPADFPRVRLGDVCELHYGKALQAEKRLGGDVPVFSSAGITGYHNEALTDSEGIIVGRKGTIGTVYYSPKPFFCIDTAYYILPNDKYDMQYLYYALKTLRLDTLNEDSAVPGLNRNTAYSQTLPLPPLPVQRSIAATLSCLDAKIELNRRVNANLEAQAQALFRDYFSQRHKDTKGWREGRLGEILQLVKEPIKKGENTVLPYLPIESIPIHSLGSLDFKPNEEAQSSLIVFKKYDILVGAMRVYFHRVSLAPCDGITRTTCFVLRPKIHSYRIFALMLCNENSSIDFAQSTSKGTTMPYAVWENGFAEMKIVIPPLDIAAKFEELVSPMIQQIHNMSFESRALAAIRDTLLPPLMSGEIEIKESV